MTVYELGSSLERLLSTLRMNRENVPLSLLKSCYKHPYEDLVRQINETATVFVKRIISTGLNISPDIPVNIQADIINQVIWQSGMDKEMGKSLSATYNVQLLHQSALALQEMIEDALDSYAAGSTNPTAINISEETR